MSGLHNNVGHELKFYYCFAVHLINQLQKTQMQLIWLFFMALMYASEADQVYKSVCLFFSLPKVKTLTFSGALLHWRFIAIALVASAS